MLTRSARITRVLAAPVFLLAFVGCAAHERPRATADSGPVQAAPQRATSRHQEARRQNEAGNEFLRRGQYDEAEHAFRLALEADPGSLEAVSGLGRVNVELGK